MLGLELPMSNGALRARAPVENSLVARGAAKARRARALGVVPVARDRRVPVVVGTARDPGGNDRGDRHGDLHGADIDHAGGGAAGIAPLVGRRARLDRPEGRRVPRPVAESA